MNRNKNQSKTKIFMKEKREIQDLEYTTVINIHVDTDLIRYR